MSESGAPRRRLGLLPWLLLTPLVFLALFCVGQLALVDIGPAATPVLGSQLRADYRPWATMVVPAINPAILADILRERGYTGRVADLVVPGEVWTTPAVAAAPPPTVTAVASAGEATPLPAPGVTVIAAVSATTTAAAPGTESPTRTATVIALATVTPTATPSLPRPASTPTRRGPVPPAPTVTASATAAPAPTDTAPPPPPATATAPPPPASPTPTLIVSPPPSASSTPPSAALSGRVFEDVDYAGGPGTAFGAGDSALANVQVELYSAQGALLATAVTDGAGVYTWTVPTGRSYFVRVVSASVGDADTPPAAGLNFATSVAAEQTFESIGLAGNGGAGALGGEDPAVSDFSTAAGAGPGDTRVAVNVAGTSVTGVDFGFAYNLIVNGNDLGQGSLRQFLLNANALAGPDQAQFNLPTSDPAYGSPYPGAFALRPLSALPALTDGGTSLDGATQEANRGDQRLGLPDLVLDGSLAGSNASGLVLQGGGSRVQSLEVRNFSQGQGVGIVIDGADDSVITGNTLTANGNLSGDVGALRVLGQAERNQISGNRFLGNGSDGLEFAVGSEASAFNVISGNTFADHGDDGLVLRGAFQLVSLNTITNNGVGNPLGCGIEIMGLTDSVLTANTVTGNGGRGGVCLIGSDSTANTVGPANTITGNAGPGIGVAPAGSLANRFTGNAIAGNAGLGIDLGNDGVTANDGADGDTGPNALLNFPVLYTATLDGPNAVIVTGEARPNAAVEFFVALPDPSGHGEGAVYLATATVTSGVAGTVDGTAWQFSARLTFAPGTLASGGLVTATATDGQGNTAEFALNVAVP
mgnify:CR=1 FL=1